jgi:penicillin-binding protein 2
MSEITESPYSSETERLTGLVFLKIALVALFGVLALRLWFLQVRQGAGHLERAELNHTRRLEINTTRGLILDRDGRTLVDNEVAFDLRVTPDEVADPEELAKRVGAILGRKPDELLERYQSFAKARPYSANVWMTGLSRADLALIEGHRYRLGGISVNIDSIRRPVNGGFAPHLIGHLGQISEAQLKSGSIPDARPGELTGQSGLERSLESQLRGVKGDRLTNVDSHGRVLEELSVVYPRPGHNVRLTIDSRLQRVAQALLGEQAGAIVVMDPRNFEILAMASSPIYNLDDFVGGISRERWRSLNEDPFTPMQNRAVSGQYSPGSTFKIPVALAALAEGVVDPQTVFNCAGVLKLGNHPFHCWARGGHGPVDLRHSLKYSCDVYYYEVGRRLGVDRLASRVREFFGLGRTLGIELPAEQPGLVPDQAWKMRRHGRSWNAGETLPVSIGQGYLLTTPLQVAQYTAVVANGGTLYRPTLVKEIVDFEGKIVQNTIPEPLNTIDIQPGYLKAVQDSLIAVVNEAGGTGRRGRLEGVLVAGKTGTTQTVSLDRVQGYSASTRPYKLRDHAWFTAYAPADAPEVVVTVLIEHAGGGGSKAAPVAAKVLAAYFDPSIDTNRVPPFQAQPDKPSGWEGEL